MANTTISSGQFGFVFPTSFGSTFTMGIFCTEDFVSDGGKIYMGSAGDSLSANFVAKVTGTVSTGVGTFASYSLPKTDAGTNPSTRYFARIFTSTGSPTDCYPITNRHLRTSLGDSITELQWATDNLAPLHPQPDGAPSTTQMNLAIAAANNSPATTTRLGLGLADTTPTDAALPVFVVSNSPNIFGTASKMVIGNNYSGADVGAQINAADAALGSGKGIIYHFGGGTISTDVVISPNHTLRLGAGTYQLAIGTEHNSHFRFKDDVTIEGVGNATIIKQSAGNHDSNYQEFVAIQGDAAYSNAGSVVRNFTLRNLQIQVNRADFDSVRAAVLLGNCHHGLVENVTFDRWGAIGLAIGGAPSGGTDPYSLGHFSDDVTVRNCTFLGVASQNLAAVNSKNFHFIDNRFIAPGQAAGPSLAVIDLETNTSSDLMEGFEVSGNIIDARLTPVTVNGISYTSIATQNGPGLIAHNQIWGRTVGGASGNLSNGIIATGNSRDVVIRGNTVTGAGQQGLNLGGTRFTVSGNTLTDTGGSSSASITATGVTNSTFFANTIYSPDAGYGDSIAESSGATGNSYSGNFVPMGTTLLGTSRVFNEDRGDGKLYNYSASGTGTIVFQYRTQYNGSTSGSTTLQASAVAGTTHLTLPATDDTLVGKNDLAVIVGANSTSYASLSAAVTAIGSTPTTLVITNAFPSGATTVVPSTLTLKFVSGGLLVLGSGHTVTINGPIIASPVQIFSGSGIARFTSNKSIPEYYGAWWGIVGDLSTDDTTALNTALAALPDYSTFNTVGLHMKVASTVTLFDRRGIRWVNRGSVGGAAAGSDAPSIVWYGADGGTVLKLSSVRDSLISNLVVSANASGDADKGADIGLSIVQNEGGANISSNNTFDYLGINANSHRTGFIGVSIGDASSQNCEFMRFTHCTVVASNAANPSSVTGIAFKLLHANVKAVVIQDTQIIGSGIGVYSFNGSFQATRVNGYGVGTIYYIYNQFDPVLIEGNEWESFRQFIVVGSGSTQNPIHIRNNGFGAFDSNTGTSSYPFIDLHDAGVVISEGNGVDTNSFTYLIKGDSQSRFTTIGDAWGNDGAEVGHLTLGVINAINSSQPFDVYDIQSVVGGGSTDRDTSQGIRHTSGSIQRVYGTVNDVGALNELLPGSLNTLQFGDGTIEITGPHQVNQPVLTIVGTAGSTNYTIAIIAKDSAGNPTMRSRSTTTGEANATLSVSNYIKVDWPAVPSATSYDVIQVNSGTYRLIANVGTNTYNIVANPSGGFTYTIPTYNQAAKLKIRGQVSSPITQTFTDADTTPSVAQTNDFTASNTGATSITAFDDGLENQIITILFTNGNTTLVNSGGLVLQGGVNFVGTANDLIVLKKRGSNWYELSRSVN